MAYLNKVQILAGLATRAERDANVLGGTLRLRELGRAQLKRSGELGRTGDANAVDGDRWNLAIIAYGVIDPESKEPLFSFEELVALASGDDPPLRTTVARDLAQRILDLSEVGPDHLKSGDPPSDR